MKAKLYDVQSCEEALELAAIEFGVDKEELDASKVEGDDKKMARQRIKRLISVMTPQSKASQSAAVWERLEQTEAFRTATDILIYWSICFCDSSE